MTASGHGLSTARVLVAGDVILDRYWHGETRRISPEAPVPVVRITDTQERPGGAANVALNVTALGARALLVGIVGCDEPGASVRRLLARAGVEARLRELADYPTVVKLRLLSQHQQLLRADFEHPRAAGGAAGIAGAFREALDEVDAVVLSDYAKGALDDPASLIAAARSAGRPLVVDPKGMDFARYRGASVLTPNLGEFTAVAGPCRNDAELTERAQRMREALDLGAVLITRGEQGMLLVDDGGARALPAQAREVFDVTGAGDTVCAMLAVALGAGQPLARATALANTAAGVVVGKLGAAAVTPEELDAALHAGEGPGGVVDETALMAVLASARARGERVVMTNGCFDLLHAGHIAYLEQARRLGDRLVVAVNSDRSVRGLKGAGRPVVPLAERMRVLAALRPVDWVVSFDEPTPERLVGLVAPDVLVKGGDYRVEDIAGAAQVLARGGQVRVLDYVAGCSSTALIERLRSIEGGQT